MPSFTENPYMTVAVIEFLVMVIAATALIVQSAYYHERMKELEARRQQPKRKPRVRKQ